MRVSGKLIAEEYIDRFTLIVGDINSGKTTLTNQILDVFCKAKGGVVTVFDFAPEITPQDLESHNKTEFLGGTLHVPDSEDII